MAPTAIIQAFGLTHWSNAALMKLTGWISAVDSLGFASERIMEYARYNIYRIPMYLRMGYINVVFWNIFPRPIPVNNIIMLNPIKIPKNTGSDRQIPNLAPDIIANKFAGPGEMLVERQNNIKGK